MLNPLSLLLVAAVASAERVPESVAATLLQQEMAERRSDTVFCVEIDGADASRTLLRGLTGENATLLPRTAYEINLQPDIGVRVKSTGQPALIVGVRNFARAAPNKASVEVYSIRHGRWAIHRTYELRFESGAWRLGRVLREIDA